MHRITARQTVAVTVDSDAELTVTAAAKDTGSTSKSAVSTADESPIGTMSMLAVLSLLAGGYVIVRKRKKEF